MELKIKQKIINDQKVMGIINENLKEIAPFEFKKIVEVNGYFICEKDDETCSLYDMNGYCRINYKDGYKELKFLKSNFNNNYLYLIAKKNDEIGILNAVLEWNNGYSKPSGTKVEIAYEFGKSDEIIEYDDKTVQLIKHTKEENLIGYWYHNNIKELVEPKFLSYNYYTIKCKNGVGLYKFKDEYGNKTYSSYRLSDHSEYNKLTMNVELIKYSELKNEKKVIGLKQKVFDSSKDSYCKSFKFEDFIPAIYSNISYDEEKQIFFLEQTINGQVKKGFMGVTFDWNLYAKGLWVWGYPNFKVEANIPCEYDDIKIIKNNVSYEYNDIEDNYALVQKDKKYGLIKFSFGKSNGDWNYNNRKNIANGKCYEIVPCIYDSITKTQNYFIGKINNEERIITNCIDKKTNQAIVIANKYNKVKQIHNEIFLCDLENGKKEVIIIEKNYYYQDSISKISPCDNAEIINNNGYGYLIKVINNNIIDIYSKNNEKNIEIIEKNIANVTYDSENNLYFITKNNGHIKCVRTSGNIVFSTDNLELEPNNLSVVYLKAIDKFKVTNNNLTRIYSNLNTNNDNQVYENRIFKWFDALKTYNYTFVCYKEILENSLITKLSHINVRDNMKETEILKGNFEIENIVLNGTRIIFSTTDCENKQKKYGVIESQEGNICIDCAYNNIEYDSINQVFICSSDKEQLIFDTDGYINENQNIKNIHGQQHVLKLTIPKK